MTTLQQIPESLQWNGESLKILDQTKLPTELHYFDATTLLDVREAIVKLQVRGAPAIGLAAAYGLYLGVREIETDQIDEFHQQARLFYDCDLTFWLLSLIAAIIIDESLSVTLLL